MNHKITIRTVRRTPFKDDSDIWFMLTRTVDGKEYEYGDLLEGGCSDVLLLKEIEHALKETRRYVEEDS